MIKALVNFGNNIREIQAVNPTVSIQSNNKITVYILRKIFKFRNICVNTKVRKTNLETHGSSEYWDWSKGDFIPQFMACIAVTSLFKRSS